MDDTIPQDDIPRKQCKVCGKILPATLENFHASDCQYGVMNTCKACCRTIREKIVGPVPEMIDGKKRCRTCGQLKPANRDFFNATSLYKSSDCLSNQCRECRKAYRRQHNANEPKETRPQSEYKQCHGACKKVLPATLDYFNYSKDTKDRLCAICKGCCKESLEQYRHRPGGKDARHAYTQSRKEVDREYRRAYRNRRMQHIRQYKRSYYQANTSRIRAYYRELYRTDQGKATLSARYHRRRAHKLANGGEFTPQDILDQYKRQRGCCYYCKVRFATGKFAYHVDHIIPISRGGSNDMSNIVLACPPCNLSKGDKLLHEWDRHRRLF